MKANLHSSSLHEFIRAALLLVYASALLLSSGCSGEDSGGPFRLEEDVPETEDAVDDAGATSNTDADVFPSGETGPDTDATSDSGDAAFDAEPDTAETNEAFLHIRQFPTEHEDGYRHTLIGFFSPSGDVIQGDCREEIQGACRFRICEDPVMENTVSAGTLTVDAPVESLEIPVDDGIPKYLHSGSEILWENLGTVEISASGDVVPPFETELETIPRAVLERPDLPAQGDPMRVDQSEPLEVEWSGVQGESAEFYLAIRVTRTSPVAAVDCHWDADRGAGTVPLSILDQIPSDEMFLGFGALSRDLVHAGPWEVTVTARTVAADDDSSTGFAHGRAVME